MIPHKGLMGAAGYVPPAGGGTDWEVAETIKSTGETITAPSVVASGELLVLCQKASGVSASPSNVTPTGFTQIYTDNLGSTNGTRYNMSYKITDGTEDSATITGMNGDKANSKILFHIQADSAISTVDVMFAADQNGGIPYKQKVCMSQLSAAMMAFTVFGEQDNTDPTSREQEPAEDAEIAGDGTDPLFVKYSIADSAMDDVIASMSDHGANNHVGAFCIVDGSLPTTMSCANTSSGAFNFMTYYGNGDEIVIDNVGFAPDAVIVHAWKSAPTALAVKLIADKHFDLDGTVSNNSTEGVQVWGSDGVTIGNHSDFNTVNELYTIMFIKNTTNVVNVTTYTGSGSAKNVAHGLGTTPDFYFVRKTSANDSAPAYHKDMSFGSVAAENLYKRIDQASPPQDDATYWEDTAPDGTNIRVGTHTETNGSSISYLLISFADDGSQVDVNGYTGNGSTTGPTVTTGFDPDFFMTTKDGSGGQETWVIWMREMNLSANPLNFTTKWDAGTLGVLIDRDIDFNSTSVQFKSEDTEHNENNDEYITLALKRI